MSIVFICLSLFAFRSSFLCCIVCMNLHVHVYTCMVVDIVTKTAHILTQCIQDVECLSMRSFETTCSRETVLEDIPYGDSRINN